MATLRKARFFFFFFLFLYFRMISLIFFLHWNCYGVWQFIVSWTLFFFFSPLVKLSWSKKMVRKWFNIKSKTEEFQADDPVYGGRFFLFLFLFSLVFQMIVWLENLVGCWEMHMLLNFIHFKFFNFSEGIHWRFNIFVLSFYLNFLATKQSKVYIPSFWTIKCRTYSVSVFCFFFPFFIFSDCYCAEPIQYSIFFMLNFLT